VNVGDIVTNGHWHNRERNIQMRARVDAIADKEAWVFALTGPHAGGRLTFAIADLSLVVEKSK